jgi:DNA polymerase-4
VDLWQRNCPELIFVSPRFDRYKEISSKIHTILGNILIWWSRFHWTKLIWTLPKIKGNPVPVCWRKKFDCVFFNEVGLTASAGISVNKFVAKIASDYNKPNGQKQ